MSRSRADEPALATDRPRAGDGYHHGDLRRALLEAALVLVAERGVDGFTLREVARRAGVSHAAPYHHFADKADLVAALAEQGFGGLAIALRTAGEGGGGTPADAVRRMGVAYVRFAIEHPATFRLLFRPELRRPVIPFPTSESVAALEAVDGVARAGLAAYQVLWDGIAACRAAGLMVGDGDALALTAWCTVHGLATLLLDGPLAAGPNTDEQIDELAGQVTAALARGLLAR